VAAGWGFSICRFGSSSRRCGGTVNPFEMREKKGENRDSINSNISSASLKVFLHAGNVVLERMPSHYTEWMI
jgi:hypothetical protein